MTRFSSSKRAILLLTLVAFSTGAESAPVTVGNSDQTLSRVSYNKAIVCFLTNGYAKRLRERAGDTAKAAVYDAHARESWGVAFQLGAALALPNDRIENDISIAESQILPGLIKDQASLLKAAADCKAMGLM